MVDNKKRQMMSWKKHNHANRRRRMYQSRLKLSKREDKQRKSLRLHESVVKQEAVGV